MFADDSLFLCKASVLQGETLQNILKVYDDATRQRVNLDKSSITFGAHVDIQDHIRLKDITGILTEGGAGSYLGLPEYFSGSKVKILYFIYDRLKSRFTRWFARTLSRGGKETLLKAIAMALPVYAM